MSRGDSWLDARRPLPPGDLAARLAEVGVPAHVSGRSHVEALAEAGRRRLDEARAESGRVRETAFRLLEADALLTYACEAALETDDPTAALQAVLTAVGQ